MKQFFAPLSLLLLLSCSSADKKKVADTPFDIGPVKAHIVDMNKSYGKRFMTNDTAFYTSRYCKDAAVLSPGLPQVKGMDAIISFFYGNGSNKEAIIELPAGEIYGNSEMVVEEGTYNFPDGKGGSVDKGKFIALWKQEDGQWKLFREIWNSDKAPEK